MLEAPFTALLDANVLFDQHVRHLLLYLPSTGVVQVRWSEQILDECLQALARRRPDIPKTRLDRLRELINASAPDVLIDGFEQLIDGLALPNPDDRHVLAAAIVSGAQVIVTRNLQDFPEDALRPLGIEAQHPDAFLLHLVDLSPHTVWSCVERMVTDTSRPRLTPAGLVETLALHGLDQSMHALRAWAKAEGVLLQPRLD